MQSHMHCSPHFNALTTDVLVISYYICLGTSYKSSCSQTARKGVLPSRGVDVLLIYVIMLAAFVSIQPLFRHADLSTGVITDSHSSGTHIILTFVFKAGHRTDTAWPLSVSCRRRKLMSWAVPRTLVKMSSCTLPPETVLKSKSAITDPRGESYRGNIVECFISTSN